MRTGAFHEEAPFCALLPTHEKRKGDVKNGTYDRNNVLCKGETVAWIRYDCYGSTCISRSIKISGA